MSYELSARKFLRKLAHYPPAETRIPVKAILEALVSSKDNFGNALCDYLGVDHCILGNSGRALFTLLLQALRKKDGSRRNEVLIPGYTCYSVAASVARAGLKVKVYDIDPKTFNPDPDSLEKALGPNTLAVVFQHLFGIPSDFQELTRLAKENDSYTIEDAAQSLGGSIDARPLGTFGDFGFFSFGRGKPLPLGSGGALIGHHLDVLNMIRLPQNSEGYPDLAKTALVRFFSSRHLYFIPEMLPLGLGETVFDPEFSISPMGRKISILGAQTLSTLDRLNEHRREIANVYDQLLDCACVISTDGRNIPVYTRYPLLAGTGRVSKELSRLGIRRMYPAAIADEPSIRPYLRDRKVSTPGASEIARTLITLPTHTAITPALARKIATKVKTHFGL